MPELKPQTPTEVMRYGHIAAAIRAGLEKKGWSLSDLNRAIGRPKADTAAYQWRNGKGAPAERNRVLVAKVLDIPEEVLIPRLDDGELPPAAAQIPAPVRRPRSFMPVPLPGVSLAAHNDLTGPLAFNVNNDGTARIRLDVTLSHEQAQDLLRMLFEAGVVFRREAD